MRFLACLLLLALSLGLVRPARAAPMDTIAKQAMVVDLSTGTVLLAKNADERMTPSSITRPSNARPAPCPTGAPLPCPTRRTVSGSATSARNGGSTSTVS